MKDKETNGFCSVCHEKCDVKSESYTDCELLCRLAAFFKNFGDPTRIKILTALDKEPLCVCELSECLSMTDSAVSHQLKVLRDADLVRSERRGKHIFYSLADSHVKDIIEKAIEHIEEC